MFHPSVPPCVIFEDDHLLVVNKPAGWNTHAPSLYAGEGIYDWLRNREPRWGDLAIIHRLDKETSGVMVFAKSRLANQSLTQQFTARDVAKKYLLLTDHSPKRNEFIVKSHIARAGERYVSGANGEAAETHFRLLDSQISDHKSALLEAMPLTGRTHQIRVQAADRGIPILGDTLYGGSPFARVCLHAAEIAFRHPLTNERVVFSAPADFDADARSALRAAIIDPLETDAFRLIHGAADGWPGWQLDRLGDWLLSQSEPPLSNAQRDRLEHLRAECKLRGVYHKQLNRQVRRTAKEEASPKLLLGEAAPVVFPIRENGVEFELSFGEGYSVGLFLDQRDNRRRFLTGHVAADFPLRVPTPHTQGSILEVLNVFAYTCGFSVCAAKAGARTTSLDLSRKYLDWGRRNFERNGLDPAAHDFIYGDAFDWLARLAKKGRGFDVIVLDPPTFSQSKERGVFRAEKDFGKLVSAALPLLKPGGVLLASTNATALMPEKFLEQIHAAIRVAGRAVIKQHYAPQPPDFPIHREEPAHLKTVWMRVG